MGGLFTKILAGGLLMAAPAVAPSAKGVASKLSPYTVADTTRRLEATARFSGGGHASAQGPMFPLVGL
jgi:hypothetical protein